MINKSNDWWETEKFIQSEYKLCNICMNDMNLIKSRNGNYWLCRICNSILPCFSGD